MKRLFSKTHTGIELEDEPVAVGEYLVTLVTPLVPCFPPKEAAPLAEVVWSRGMMFPHGGCTAASACPCLRMCQSKGWH